MKSESINLFSRPGACLRQGFSARSRMLSVLSILQLSFLYLLQPSAEAAELKSESSKSIISQAKMHMVPFFAPGQTVTLSVSDLAGIPLSGAEVLVNDDLITSDSNGLLSFTATDTEVIELSLMSSDKRKIDKRKFRLRADRFFAESEVIAEEASALSKVAESQSAFPSISFAPAVVSPGDEFVIVGTNFSVKTQNDHVEIDGVEAQVLSATPSSMLVLAPTRLKLGPLRELTVTVAGQASNVCETDVARTFFSHVKTEEDDVSPEKGKIGMNGTNVPCLISVRNPDLEAASLWSPEPLGSHNVVLTPGGEQNYVALDVKLARPDLEPQIQLSLRSELDAAQDAEKIPPQLRIAAERAQIMRLERRRIAAEFRLQEIRKRIAEAPIDNERLVAESHALSLRMNHVSKMLMARRALFEALGGTDAQYRQAIDDATGGAMLSLDLSVKPVQVISEATPRVTVTTERKGRSHRLIEPPIRLLPPMTEAEQQIALSRNAAPQNQDPTGDNSQDGLRPSLPEEAPHSSQEARSASTGTVHAVPVKTWKKTSGKGSSTKNLSSPAAGKSSPAKKTAGKQKSISAKKVGKSSSRSTRNSRSAKASSSRKSTGGARKSSKKRSRRSR